MSTTDVPGPEELVPAEILASTGAIAVVAVARAKPGTEQELAAAFAAAIPLYRAEQGCEQYVVHVSDDQPGVYTYYERWSSGADLIRHMEHPALQAYAKTFSRNLDFEISWLRPIDV